MTDQAPSIRDRDVRDVMVLPMAFPVRPGGIERGLAMIADKLGFGTILYVKQDGYIEPARLERMVEAGTVRFVKYAVERRAPAGDRYLSDIVAAVGQARVARSEERRAGQEGVRKC